MTNRIALASGCFAAITPAHVAYLREAATYGELWVAIASASVIRELKGERAVIPDFLRREMLQSLPFVAAVAIQEFRTPEKIIRYLKPSVWIKGGDYSIDQLAALPEGRAVLECGGRIVVAHRYPGPSTTELACGTNCSNSSTPGKVSES